MIGSVRRSWRRTIAAKLFVSFIVIAALTAIAALVLTVAAVGGFGAFLYALHGQNADQRLVDEIRAREAANQSTEALMKEADRRLHNEAEAAAASR